MKYRTLVGLAASGVLLWSAVMGGTAAAAGGPGGLDPSFGTAGVAVTDIPAGTGVGHDAVLLPGGDILVGGDFGLARFLPSGRPDPAFGTGGVAATTFQTGALGGGHLAVQPDGKIIWVGNTGDANGLTSDFAIARYTANGALDTGFGHGGQVTTQFFDPPLQGAQQVADVALVQPDGKILVAGSARQGQVRGAPIQAALLRLTSDGTPDPTFGTGGQVLTSGGSGPVTALGLDAAGDVFALPAHIEFGPDGRPKTLTPAAITTAAPGNTDRFLPGGQYLHAGNVGVTRHDVGAQVRRFTADGGTDWTSPAIDYTGTTAQSTDSGSAVAVQADGRTLVGGSHFAGSTLFGLARLTATGGLDPTFGTGGVLTTDIPGGFGFSVLLVQPDGKVIGVGSGQDGTGQTELILARYLG
jgi:uncharacterized delta-60 repeat protein